MWVNPKHPRYAELTARTSATTYPGPDDDEVLAALPRGRDAELRVAVAEYEGHPFVSLRVWQAGPDGEFRPVAGKGVSVRLKELGPVAKALLAAEKAILRGAARRIEPETVPTRGFDEFA